jgi:hypothetical protein
MHPRCAKQPYPAFGFDNLRHSPQAPPRTRPIRRVDRQICHTCAARCEDRDLWAGATSRRIAREATSPLLTARATSGAAQAFPA